jgi:hypothetical protein
MYVSVYVYYTEYNENVWMNWLDLSSISVLLTKPATQSSLYVIWSQLVVVNVDISFIYYTLYCTLLAYLITPQLSTLSLSNPWINKPTISIHICSTTEWILWRPIHRLICAVLQNRSKDDMMDRPTDQTSKVNWLKYYKSEWNERRLCTSSDAYLPIPW